MSSTSLPNKKLRKIVVIIIAVVIPPFLFRTTSNRKTGQHQEPSQPLHKIPSHHHICNYQDVPYVIGELPASQILRYSNYSLVRFGDLDLDLIQGRSWDCQNASKELSEALLRTLTNPLPYMFIGIYDIFSPPSRISKWHADFMHNHDEYRQFLLKTIKTHKEYVTTTISTPFVNGKQNSCVYVDEVYENLRAIWKDKTIVLLRGANLQQYRHDVFDTARTQKIFFAPRYQAWKQYETLKTALLAESTNNIFILSAGPVSKVLAYDLVMSGRRVIDVGHMAKDYDIFMGNKTISKGFWKD